VLRKSCSIRVRRHLAEIQPVEPALLLQDASVGACTGTDVRDYILTSPRYEPMNVAHGTLGCTLSVCRRCLATVFSGLHLGGTHTRTRARMHAYHRDVGRDSSVTIVSRNGMGDPGIESRWGPDFPHLSISVWRPPSILWNEYTGSKAAGAWR
jgi:hypothetical protein